MICPFFGDQHLWAQALHKKGVAVEPVPIEHITDQALTAAFETLRGLNPEGEAMQREAAKLGEQLAREDGVAGALDAFYRHLPVEGLVCDVSLMLGSEQGSTRMARWYYKSLGLKVSHEVYLLLRSALLKHRLESDVDKLFVEYCHGMGWSFSEPQRVSQGIRQGVLTGLSRYVQAVGGLVAKPVQGTYRGFLERAPLKGLGTGLVDGVQYMSSKALSGTQRVFQRPMQALRGNATKRLMPTDLVLARRPTADGSADDDASNRVLFEVEPIDRSRREQLMNAFDAVTAVQRAWAAREADKGSCNFVHQPLSKTSVMEIVAELGYPEKVQESVFHEINASMTQAQASTKDASQIVGRLVKKVTESWQGVEDKYPEPLDITFEMFVTLLRPHGPPPSAEIGEDSSVAAEG